MATEKADLPHDVTERHSSSDSAAEAGAPLDLPKSWKYRSIKIGPWTLPWYASPQVQLVIVSFVCFLCPGMFNALNGMGGGGQVDTAAANKANVALYSTFAVVGFFAGTFTNKLGIKTALGIGGVGYSIYVASYLSFSHNQNYGFSIFAGALLGACAGLLWCAQGAIMMSYPPEESKGRYISWFWMIFNLGAVIGGLIPLGQNMNVRRAATVTDGTYIGFLILTLIGAGLAMTLVSAKSVVRSDGSKVILMKNPSWWTEIKGLGEVFVSDPYILFLFPMFFASNWFYTYQFNNVNAARFNTRTRALNSVVYYAMQIVGAFVFGYALDQKSIRRTVRAKCAWVVLMVLTMAIWGGGYAFQKEYTRAEVNAAKEFEKANPDLSHPLFMDWTDAGYGGPFVLYIFYGFYDAAWQTAVYWFMGSLTNNGRKLANFAGFYKGIQSAGSAIIWRLDDIGIPYMNLFASCWALLVASLLIAAPVFLWKIKDSVDLEEDLKFSDETFAEVAPTAEVKKAEQSGML